MLLASYLAAEISMQRVVSENSKCNELNHMTEYNIAMNKFIRIINENIFASNTKVSYGICEDANCIAAYSFIPAVNC